MYAHLASTLMAPPETIQNRQRLASVTWWCEVFTFGLTAVYCAIAAMDIAGGRARLTSAEWFRQGFCIWEGPAKLNSHKLCVVADLLCGGALVWQNWRRHHTMGIALSCFCMLHGMGHLVFDVIGAELLQDLHPSTMSRLELAASYVGVGCFLAIAPYVGHHFGIDLKLCVLIHLTATLAFLYVPLQFAFGAVQLILNCWYCLPRVLFFKCSEADAVRLRVDDGWAAASIGNLFLMPVVFSEMLWCESFYQSLGGHFAYDASILVLVLVFSASVWQQYEKSGDAKQH